MRTQRIIRRRFALKGLGTGVVFRVSDFRPFGTGIPLSREQDSLGGDCSERSDKTGLVENRNTLASLKVTKERRALAQGGEVWILR